MGPRTEAEAMLSRLEQGPRLGRRAGPIPGESKRMAVTALAWTVLIRRSRRSPTNRTWMTSGFLQR